MGNQGGMRGGMGPNMGGGGGGGPNQGGGGGNNMGMGGGNQPMVTYNFSGHSLQQTLSIAMHFIFCTYFVETWCVSLKVCVNDLKCCVIPFILHQFHSNIMKYS